MIITNDYQPQTYLIPKNDLTDEDINLFYQNNNSFIDTFDNVIQMKLNSLNRYKVEFPLCFVYNSKRINIVGAYKFNF